MDEYNLRDAINCLYSVVDIINNGYIKLGRNLLKGKTNKDEWKESLSTLYYLIKFIIDDFKSIVPFFSEKEYLNLRNLSLDDSYFAFNSIHLGTNCRSKYIKIDNSLSTDFNIIYTIISNVHKIRGSCNLSLKKPIKSLTVLLDNDFDNIYSNRYLNYLNFIFDECNVLDINFKTHDDIKVTKNIKPVKAFFFKKYGKEITETFNKIQSMDNNQLNDIINTEKFEESLFNISYNIDDDMSNIEIKEFTFESNNILLLVNKQYDESIDKIYYYRLIGTSIQ
jgi:isoleucyl-tRNA synthetase